LSCFVLSCLVEVTDKTVGRGPAPDSEASTPTPPTPHDMVESDGLDLDENEENEDAARYLGEQSHPTPYQIETATTPVLAHTARVARRHGLIMTSKTKL